MLRLGLALRQCISLAITLRARNNEMNRKLVFPYRRRQNVINVSLINVRQSPRRGIQPRSPAMYTQVAAGWDGRVQHRPSIIRIFQYNPAAICVNFSFILISSFLWSFLSIARSGFPLLGVFFSL